MVTVSKTGQAKPVCSVLYDGSGERLRDLDNNDAFVPPPRNDSLRPHDGREPSGVLIVGAGLGRRRGLPADDGAPGQALGDPPEARGSMGGTWDLFRYPGHPLHDSDMFTLAYPLRPWQGEEGDRGRAGDPRTSARRPPRTASTNASASAKIVAASWSSDGERAGPSGVDRLRTGTRRRRAAPSALYVCGGYYSYDEAHQPPFRGAEPSRAHHPSRWWPGGSRHRGQARRRHRERRDGRDARSGARRARGARHDAPALAQLRRLAAARDRVADALAAFCRRAACCGARRERAHRPRVLPVLPALPGRGTPLSRSAREAHASPTTRSTRTSRRHCAPWDQRLCIDPRRRSLPRDVRWEGVVVTDAIDGFTERGVRLASGGDLDADVIVTATGLKVIPWDPPRGRRPPRLLRGDALLYKVSC